ncbi:MAG: hypothetical protein LBL87_00005 [Ruminococcus sp.]|jgi:hypothetical protein|nr:hypothetical protein [Ruminococcus sp.]
MSGSCGEQWFSATYKSVAVSPEFEQIERLRERTRHNEASALGRAKREGLNAGRKRREIEISKQMKALGLSPDVMEQILKGGT